MHDPGAGFDGARVEAIDHLVHPQDFARQVDIVGARFHAGSHDALSIPRIGSHSRQDASGALRHGSQRVGVVAIRHDELCTFGGSNLVANRFKLVVTPGGHRPTNISIDAVALDQVLGDKPSGKTGGSKHNDIELAILTQVNLRMKALCGFGLADLASVGREEDQQEGFDRLGERRHEKQAEGPDSGHAAANLDICARAHVSDSSVRVRTSRYRLRRLVSSPGPRLRGSLRRSTSWLFFS